MKFGYVLSEGLFRVISDIGWYNFRTIGSLCSSRRWLQRAFFVPLPYQRRRIIILFVYHISSVNSPWLPFYSKLLARCVSVSVPAWRDKWIDYKILKKLLYAIPSSSVVGDGKEGKQPSNTTAHSSGTSTVENPDTVIRRLMNNPGEIKFYRQLRYEVRKVAVHFALCEAQLCERYIQLISALENFIVHRNNHPSSSSVPSNILTATYSSTDENIGTEARRLLAMVVKLSSFAIQLENYAVMNYCGFGKALKKHDKITGETTKLAVMQAWVNIQSFAEYPILLKLLSGIEEAWRLLVALQPEEASINIVDNQEAKTLMNLHQVKSFSNIHRAKEIAERNTTTTTSSSNSVPSSPSVRLNSQPHPSSYSSNTDDGTANVLMNTYPLTHQTSNDHNPNYIVPYHGDVSSSSVTVTESRNHRSKRELDHDNNPSSHSHVGSLSTTVSNNVQDSSIGNTSGTGKRRKVGTNV